MKALATGAAGFIASHLAERPVHQGADVVGLDLEAVPDGVTHVFHLAAQAGVRESWGRHFRVYTISNVEVCRTASRSWRLNSLAVSTMSITAYPRSRCAISRSMDPGNWHTGGGLRAQYDWMTATHD
jgi:nucleoside-diphosphate-sugar epimerase